MRVATIADVSEIVRVTNAAYRVEDFFVDGDRTHAAEVASKMSAMSAAGSDFLVVDAPSGGGLAASVYVELRGDRVYFAMLAVDPARQKTGLGRVLIEGIESYGRKAGCTAVEMDVVNLREELPAFYEAMGFKATGTAPFTKRHKLKLPIHLILMSKQL